MSVSIEPTIQVKNKNAEQAIKEAISKKEKEFSKSKSNILETNNIRGLLESIENEQLKRIN